MQLWFGEDRGQCWGQMGSNSAKLAAAMMPAILMNSRFAGQVGQESHLAPFGIGESGAPFCYVPFDPKIR